MLDFTTLMGTAQKQHWALVALDVRRRHLDAERGGDGEHARHLRAVRAAARSGTPRRFGTSCSARRSRRAERVGPRPSPARACVGWGLLPRESIERPLHSWLIVAATASLPIPARTGADPALGSCGVGFGSRVACAARSAASGIEGGQADGTAGESVAERASGCWGRAHDGCLVGGCRADERERAVRRRPGGLEPRRANGWSPAVWLR